MCTVIFASTAPSQLLHVCGELELLLLFTHIEIKAIETCKLFYFDAWCLLGYFSIHTLFVARTRLIYTILRCCVLCHWYMFYGRLRFNVFLLYMLSFYCSLYFTCTLSEMTTIKDDQYFFLIHRILLPFYHKLNNITGDPCEEFQNGFPKITAVTNEILRDIS